MLHNNLLEKYAGSCDLIQDGIISISSVLRDPYKHMGELVGNMWCQSTRIPKWVGEGRRSPFRQGNRSRNSGVQHAWTRLGYLGNVFGHEDVQNRNTLRMLARVTLLFGGFICVGPSIIKHYTTSTREACHHAVPFTGSLESHHSPYTRNMHDGKL